MPEAFGDARVQCDIRLEMRVSSCGAIHLVEALLERTQVLVRRSWPAGGAASSSDQSVA